MKTPPPPGTRPRASFAREVLNHSNHQSMRWHQFRRAAKLAVGVPVATMFGQMWYVRGKFRLPPDACGPDNGVVQPAPSTAASNNSSSSSGLRAALFRWPSSSSSSSSNTASSLPRKHIVFMGDSLVTGVGCSAEASAEHGHVLPRRVAEVIAQQLQVEVSWRLIGETGADVRTLRSTLLPSLEPPNPYR